VHSINGVRNRYGGSGRPRQADPQFYALLERLRRMQDSGALGLRVQKTGEMEGVVLTFRGKVDPALEQDVTYVRQTLGLALDAQEFQVAYGSIAKDDKVAANPSNDAVALIRVVGPPACLPPLLSMVAHPHSDETFRYVGPDAALKCGGVKAIKDVVRAMPDLPYEQVQLAGSVVNAIATLSPRDFVIVELRDLLTDKSRMARWVAVETRAAMKSVEDSSASTAACSGGRVNVPVSASWSR
jgi:hypothetical protein